MENILGAILFMTQEEFDTLRNTGTVDIDGVTYNYDPSRYIYITQGQYVTVQELDSSIETLDTNLSDAIFRNSEDIALLNQEVSNRLPSVNASLNMVEDVNPTYNGDNVYLNVGYRNLAENTVNFTDKQLNLASDSGAGLMSTADYTQIRNNTARIEQLEGRTARLIYTANTNPTAEEVNAFVVGLGYSAPFTGIAVVVDQTFHIWHYYSNTQQWKDDGPDTVSIFTNNIAGVILGSTMDGKIYAETDGTGSVNGWGALTTQVANAENNIASNTQAIQQVSSLLSSKQDTLTAGFGIDITGNVVSTTSPKLIISENF